MREGKDKAMNHEEGMKEAISTTSSRNWRSKARRNIKI